MRTDTRHEGRLSEEEFLGCLSRFGFKLRKEVERDLGDSLTDHEREKERDRGDRGDRDRGDRGERGSARKGVDYNDFTAALKAENDAQDAAEGNLERLREQLGRDLSKGAGMQEVRANVYLVKNE